VSFFLTSSDRETVLGCTTSALPPPRALSVCSRKAETTPQTPPRRGRTTAMLRGHLLHADLDGGGGAGCGQVFTFLSIATTGLVSQASCQQRPKAVSRVLHNAFVVALLCGTTASVVLRVHAQSHPFPVPSPPPSVCSRSTLPPPARLRRARACVCLFCCHSWWASRC